MEAKKEKERARKTWVGSRFTDTYWPSETPGVIRLIPGQYKVQSAVEVERGKYGVVTDTLVYYTCGQHFDGVTQKSTICSGGPMFLSREHAQPCIPCKKYFSTPKDSNGKRVCRFGFRSDIYIFTVLDYLPYVKVEEVDKHGLVKLSAKSGKPYTKWVRKGTVDADPIEEKLGHVMHWSMFQSDFKELMDADALINQSCGSCGGEDSIARLALVCQKCGDAIIDCEQTSIPPIEQDRMLGGPVVCPHCKHTAPPVEYLHCAHCANPVRATIFDVDLTVSRKRERGSHVRIHKYSQPHPVDISFGAKPLNLSGIYAPDDIETQERLFNLSWADVATGTA